MFIIPVFWISQKMQNFSAVLAKGETNLLSVRLVTLNIFFEVNLGNGAKTPGLHLLGVQLNGALGEVKPGGGI